MHIIKRLNPCTRESLIELVKVEKFKAFTLAEILIVIGIIGTVAAFTISTLISNSQKTQSETGLKKAYTELNQALLQLTVDYGSPSNLSATGLMDLTFGQLLLGRVSRRIYKNLGVMPRFFISI